MFNTLLKKQRENLAFDDLHTTLSNILGCYLATLDGSHYTNRPFKVLFFS